MAKGTTKPDEARGHSAKLDEAIDKVMAAMPKYGNRMNYADMKRVVGWPSGYYNITKLARELEARGLCRSEKRPEDRINHWTPAKGAARGKGPKAAKPAGKPKSKPAKAAASK